MTITSISASAVHTASQHRNIEHSDSFHIEEFVKRACVQCLPNNMLSEYFSDQNGSSGILWVHPVRS